MPDVNPNPASTGQGGVATGSNPPGAGVGLKINISYDASAANAPAGFQQAVQAAAQYFESVITTPITVNITFGYGTISGQPMDAGALAESSPAGVALDYAQVMQGLAAAATSPADAAALNALLAADPTRGGQFFVASAEAKALGFIAPADPAMDGYVGLAANAAFTFDPNNRAVAGEYDAIGAIEHEISEVLGRIAGLGQDPGDGSAPFTPLDLFRYTAPGVRDLTQTAGGFSVDGQALIKAFDDPANGGDAGDWATTATADAFDAFGQTGVAETVSATDLQVLDVLGYSTTAPVVPPQPSTPTPVVAATGTLTFNADHWIQPAEAYYVTAAPGHNDVVGFQIAADSANQSTTVTLASYGAITVIATGHHAIGVSLNGPLTVFDNLAAGAIRVEVTAVGDAAYGVVSQGSKTTNNAGLIQSVSLNDTAIGFWGNTNPALNPTFTNSQTGTVSAWAARSATGVYLSYGEVDNQGLITVTETGAQTSNHGNDATGVSYASRFSNSATGRVSVWGVGAATGVAMQSASNYFDSVFSNAGAITVIGDKATGVSGAAQFANSGVITATSLNLTQASVAVLVDNPYATTFTNTGTIKGDFAFLDVSAPYNFDGSGDTPRVQTEDGKFITNSGTIFGEFQFDTTTITRSFGISNTGTIVGDIHFGSGNSSYDGAGGALWGTVYLGYGYNYVALGANGGIVFGGGGQDTLVGGAGADVFVIERGTNAIDGGGGRNTLSFADSDTAVTVDLGAGTATAGGQDTIKNIQTVVGGAHGDTLIAGATAATLIAGSAHDVLTGGAAADTLVAGAGGDVMTGGGGGDSFIYSVGDHQDVITDFGANGDQDVLNIYGYAGAISTVQQGADTLITLSATDSVLLQGVQASSLTGGKVVYAAAAYRGPTLPALPATPGISTVHVAGNLTINAGEVFNVRNHDVGFFDYGAGVNGPAATFSNYGVVTVSNTNANVLGYQITTESVTPGTIFLNAAGASFSVTSPDGSAVGLMAPSALPAFVNQGTYTVSAYGDAYGLQTWDDGFKFSNTATGVISVSAEVGQAVGVETNNGVRPGGSFVNSGAITATAGDSAIGVLADRMEGGALTNSGVITAIAGAAGAETVGLALSGLYEPPGSFYARTQINNSGTITADFAVLGYNRGVSSANSPTVILNNSGTLNGNVALGQGAQDIHNTGHIVGNIYFGQTDSIYGTANGLNIDHWGDILGGGTGLKVDSVYQFEDTGSDVYDGAGGSLTGAIYLAHGVNTVTLGADNGVVYGGGGADTITGGAGNDFIQIRRGANTIDGGGGFNTLSFAGVDMGVTVNLATGVATAAGADTVKNIQQVIGSGFNDTMIAGASAATFIAGAGYDTLTGGAAGDTLVAGAGGDLMTGGGGNDAFVYSAGDHQLTITDFGAGGDHDVLHIDGYAAALSVLQTGADTLIKLSATDSILLKNVQASALTAANVVYSQAAYAPPRLPSQLPVFGATTLVFTYDLTLLAGEQINEVNQRYGLIDDVFDSTQGQSTFYHNLDNFGAIKVATASGDVVGLQGDLQQGDVFGVFTNEAGAIFSVAAASGGAAGVNGGPTTAVNNSMLQVQATGDAYGVENGGTFTNASAGVFTVTSTTGAAYGFTSIGKPQVSIGGVFHITGASAAYGLDLTQMNWAAISITGDVKVVATGAGAHSYGILVNGGYFGSNVPNTITNSGTLTAQTAIGEDSTGLSPLQTPRLTITNSGTINGDIILGAGANQLQNSGTINGNLVFGDGAAPLTNTGAITGNITFGVGDMTISGAGGTFNGVIRLGYGVNTVTLGQGAAVIYGGFLSDTITGGAGDDFIEIGRGADTIDGGGGFNTLSFADTDRAVTVNLATGTASANGADLIKNIQRVVGSSFNDTMIAGAAAATFIAGSGFDTLIGGAGGDTLVAGAGGDLMTGGGGNNTFIYSAGDHALTVTDFGTGGDHDVLKIYGYAAALSVQQLGADTLIRLSASDTILLKNTLVAAVTATTVVYSAAAYQGPVLPPSPPIFSFGANSWIARMDFHIDAGDTFKTTAPAFNAQLGVYYGLFDDRTDLSGSSPISPHLIDNAGTISLAVASGDAVAVLGDPTGLQGGNFNNDASATLTVSAAAGVAYGLWTDGTPITVNAGQWLVSGSAGAYGVDAWSGYPFIGPAAYAFTNAATGAIVVSSSGGAATGVEFHYATRMLNAGAVTVSGVGLANGVVEGRFESAIFQNDGVITVTASGPGAVANGIDVSGLGPGLNGHQRIPTPDIINTGTITAQTAVRVEYDGSTPFSLVSVDLANSGTINGDINLGGSWSTVTNTGQINGNILLFYGSDLIDLRGGGFKGAIVIDPLNTSGQTTSDPVSNDPVSDTIYTGASASLIKILGGNGALAVAVTGGAGGQTTVQFDEAVGQAKFTHNADGSWTVAAGADGTETLTNVQTLVFTDRTVSFAQPLFAGADLIATAVNGAAAAVGYGAITAAVTDMGGSALTVTGVAMAAGSSAAGTVSLNAANKTVVFTPAAGFAGTAVVNVTVTDGAGYTTTQPVDVNVVVQASAPVVIPPNTTTTTVNGSVTTIQTFSPTGTLISTETIAVNGGTTQTQFFSAAGAQTSAQIKQVNGAITQVQNFDGSWNQLNASITNTLGGGNSIVQNFDGSWTQTGAVVTTVSGAMTQVQNFNASWVQQSATITIVNGAVTQTQNFDAHWSQTSANLTTNLGGGVVESQNFDAHWAQTSASITSHPSANQTEIQNFNAAWVQTGASIITVAGGQTTTQSFDASWAQTGVVVDTPNADAALSDRLDTYGANWNPLTEVDTFLNGGQSYFTYGQTGGGQSFTAASGHSTTFIFTPGQIAGDAIAGLHSNNLGGAIHDVIDFEGYGAGAHLVQVDATHWQVVSSGHASESFTLTGGATLAAGDYAFVPAGSNLTSSSVGDSALSAGSGSVTVSNAGSITGTGATGIIAQSVGGGSVSGGALAAEPASTPSAALFSQFSASGFDAPALGGGMIVAPAASPQPLLAAPAG